MSEKIIHDKMWEFTKLLEKYVPNDRKEEFLKELTALVNEHRF